MRASTVDAFSNGFRAVVVEEAVFDRAWLPHCVSLFDLHHKYADVLRLPTALRLLKEAAGERAVSEAGWGVGHCRANNGPLSNMSPEVEADRAQAVFPAAARGNA